MVRKKAIDLFKRGAYRCFVDGLNILVNEKISLTNAGASISVSIMVSRDLLISS